MLPHIVSIWENGISFSHPLSTSIASRLWFPFSFHFTSNMLDNLADAALKMYPYFKYMYIQGWFMSMYDKNHYNIVK